MAFIQQLLQLQLDAADAVDFAAMYFGEMNGSSLQAHGCDPLALPPRSVSVLP